MSLAGGEVGSHADRPRRSLHRVALRPQPPVRPILRPPPHESPPTMSCHSPSLRGLRAAGLLALLHAVPVLVAPAAATEPVAAQVVDPYEAIPVEEIERGQRGWGLSVFAGTEPERFEVEVLGVLRNTTPELSYILARLSGHDLERSGVAGGMSGSPVYIDGRLAGAVAFSYTFGMDAIAGITPINAMRRLSTLPVDVAIPDRTPATELDLAALLASPADPAAAFAEAMAVLRPAPLAGRSALQWSAAGFGDLASEALGAALGPLAPGGRLPVAALATGSTEATPELLPGSAVAAVLVHGDLNLAAHGTVTDREGDHILAFGHPVFSVGPLSLPMAGSEVVTVIANRASSFKVSNAGAVVGAFDQDREAGFRGRIGAVAPTIPLTVRLRGLEEHDYHMQVAELPELTPTLISLASLGAVSAGTYSLGRQGLDLEARYQIAGHPDLTVRQSFDGDQAVLEAVIYLLGYSRFLQLNPLERVEIEGVEVEFTQSDRPRTATLVAAHAGRTVVAPGETVPITLELQAYRGERYRRTVDFEVPEEAVEGRFFILLGDGTSMDGARLSIEHRQPESFDQAMAVLRSFHPKNELQLFGLQGGAGLAVAGEPLPGLPGSVRAIFAAAPNGGARPLPLVIVHTEVEVLERPIEGILRLDLEVRRPAH